MKLVSIYLRVLGLLGNVRRVAWFLALSNLAIASTQFAEPILFGKVIDSLTSQPGSWQALAPLLALWVAFGLFNILASTLIALHSDRLAHRQRYYVLRDYFQHILQLPLNYHGDIHSGRLMKIMLQGTDSLWSMWVNFFRDHLASLVMFFLLLPLSLFLNWRLALLLIVLTAVFAALTWYVIRKTDALQARSKNTTRNSQNAPPIRSATSRWCTASCASTPRCMGCERHRQAARRTDSGAVVVGGDFGADARGDHDHHPFDHRSAPGSTSRVSPPSARSSPSWASRAC
jgi:ABC-type multidrug transport system fused ATPase/permease subunit